MKISYIYKTLLIITCCLLMTISIFFITDFFLEKKIAAYSAKFSVKRIAHHNLHPNFSRPIHIEIEIQDDPTSSQGRIVEVKFAEQELFLKPIDANGNRGRVYLQVRPGTYTMRWIVENEKQHWPRTVRYEKTITIDKTMVYKHILIKGKTLKFS